MGLDFNFEEEPMQILDREVNVVRKNNIPLVKVLWQYHGTKEASEEPKDSIRHQYPHLFELGKC